MHTKLIYVKLIKEITKENGRHRNDGNDDNRLFTRGTNYPCGRP